MLALDKTEEEEWQLAQYIEWQRAALMPMCLFNWLRDPKKEKPQTLNNFIPKAYWLPGMEKQQFKAKPWQELKAQMQGEIQSYNNSRR